MSDHDLSDAEKAAMNEKIANQMQVMNTAFAGASSLEGVDTPFRFTRTNTTFTTNPAWAIIEKPLGNEDLAMKTALHAGTLSTLNIYITDLPRLAGLATFPPTSENQERFAFADGVNLNKEALPGGSLPDQNQGDTLVHEVGHWLFLFHTFDGKCGAKGDRVSDTAAHSKPNLFCADEGIDSCRNRDGIDPVHNFMNYSEDFCMDHFTAGQVLRMSNTWSAFRS